MHFLGICGANGRMGRAISSATAEFKEIISIKTFLRGDDLDSFILSSDFIIDFSTQEATSLLLEALISSKSPKPLLIGTTALSDFAHNQIELLSKKTAVMHAPNVSIGANLQAMLVERIASILGNNYDAEIIDIHHKAKKDAPSGTAYMLADHINQGLIKAGSKEHKLITARVNSPQRQEHEIAISSIRAGNVPGKHEVFFFGKHDTISVTHESNSRELFAASAIKAILWLKDQKPGNYCMHDMLKF